MKLNTFSKNSEDDEGILDGSSQSFVVDTDDQFGKVSFSIRCVGEKKETTY